MAVGQGANTIQKRITPNEREREREREEEGKRPEVGEERECGGEQLMRPDKTLPSTEIDGLLPRSRCLSKRTLKRTRKVFRN
jgi:hypothetical protein